MNCDKTACLELINLIYEKKNNIQDIKQFNEVEINTKKCYEYEQCIEKHIRKLMSQIS